MGAWAAEGVENVGRARAADATIAGATIVDATIVDATSETQSAPGAGARAANIAKRRLEKGRVSARDERITGGRKGRAAAGAGRQGRERVPPVDAPRSRRRRPGSG